MLLLKVLKKTFWPLKFGSIITWVGTISSIIGLFQPINWLNRWVNPVYAIYFILTAIIIRYFYLLNKDIKIIEKQLEDRNIWGEAIKSLKTAYSHIHYMRKEEPFLDEKFMNGMIDFCDVIHEFYNKKTNAQCCVSIKVPVRKVELDDAEQLSALSFVNLCRDSHHPMRDNDKYRKQNHTVLGNTAYNVVINNILKDYRNNPQGKKIIGYVNNDITNDANYKTTSPYDEGKIPYKSEVVFPLIPILSSESKKYVLVGFICIDCDERDKFKDIQNYEAPMIEGIADGLYDIICTRNEKKQWVTL